MCNCIKKFKIRIDSQYGFYFTKIKMTNNDKYQFGNAIDQF
jgi:hypothetical protein